MKDERKIKWKGASCKTCGILTHVEYLVTDSTYGIVVSFLCVFSIPAILIHDNTSIDLFCASRKGKY